MSTTNASDGGGDELDLGDVEPGVSPAERPAPEGQHPWSPSQLDEYEHGAP